MFLLRRSPGPNLTGSVPVDAASECNATPVASAKTTANEGESQTSTER